MEKIDFVITWVDGNDENWRAERAKYSAEKNCDCGENRYRTLGTLKYWFRAAEKFAPWVNRIHFITWGHLPEWLNTSAEKLNIVNHKDYIPKKYLPTFSSHPIELNLHRIPGLSKQFVYFNDDMLINSSIEPEFFFHNGLPCDFAYIDNIYFDDSDDVYAHIQVNEAWELSRHFSYIKSFLRHPQKFCNIKYPLKNNLKNILKLENRKFFVGLENHHLASAYLKETYDKVWQDCYEILDKVCSNRFRSPYDISQSIFRYYQIAEGKFYPVSKQSRGRSFSISNNNDGLIDAIQKEKYKIICINDTPAKLDFDIVRNEILFAYEKKLPDKSEFEK